MLITLSPMRRDDTLEVSRKGDVLTINGVAVDLSAATARTPLEDHGCDWITGPVERRGKTLALTLILPHGPDAPEAMRFPAPVEVAGDGPVALPAAPEPDMRAFIATIEAASQAAPDQA